MIPLPAPKSALGKAVERAIVLAIAAILSAVLANVALTPLAYFAIKTVYDLLNANVPNL